MKKPNFQYDCIIFGGGGYKTSQYIGHCFYLLNNNLINENTKFIGSSLGSFGCILSIIAYKMYHKDKELTNLMSSLLSHCIESRLNMIKLCGNWWNKFEKTLNEILVNIDIDLFNNNKVEIVTTKILPIPSKKIFNKFKNKMELLNCLKASCMIPFWSNNYPLFYFKNNFYADGGFVDLIPKPPQIQNKTNINLTIYNETVWYRTFVPLLNEDDYVQDIIKGYLKCKALTENMMKHTNI